MRSNRWDIARTNSEGVRDFYRAAPGGVPTMVAFSQSERYDDVDADRAAGVIRNLPSMPSARMAGWRCSAAMSRWTAVS